MSRVDDLMEQLRRLQDEVDGELGVIRCSYPDVDFEAGFEWSVPLQPARPTRHDADLQAILADYEQLRDQLGMVASRVQMAKATAERFPRPTETDEIAVRLLGIPVEYREDMANGVIEWVYRTELGAGHD